MVVLVSKTLDLTGIGRRLVPSWPLIIGLAVFIRALAQPIALLNDPDTYLHIAAGRWMLTHAALPVHDPFSHSLAGAAWVPPVRTELPPPPFAPIAEIHRAFGRLEHNRARHQ